MKHLIPFFISGLFLLGACSAEQPPERVESTQSKKASAEELKLAAGKEVYESNCGGCHDAGVGGAPELGDKIAWNGRIAEGKDVLLSHSVDGFEGKKGMMPPRGGNTTLSDGEIKNAIAYMTSKIKRGPSDANQDIREPIEKYQQ
jgi:cytochrome c5